FGFHTRRLQADLLDARPAVSGNLTPPSLSDTLVYDASNWVRCWYDPRHRVADPVDGTTALRAISRDGELFWLVFHRVKQHPFHADTEQARDAIEMARVHWARRRTMRARMRELYALRRAVIKGQKRGTILVEDAAAAGLCRMGTEAFLRRTGLVIFAQSDGAGRAGALHVRVPARLLALLSYFEPQAALCLLTAFDRMKAEQLSETKSAILKQTA
ncbi:MAG: hypothetical protein AAGH73_06085, partial [Pseudomonadota bacterium]